MFSGIIEELGSVRQISNRGNYTRLEICADITTKDVKIGDSISINGVCLTLVEIKGDILSFDVINESSNVSVLGQLNARDKVNLERALKVGDRNSGHFVSGHVDCIGIIRKKGMVNGNVSFEIAVPEKYSKWMVQKGSIAVDGISLTVMQLRHNVFNIYVIPHTLQNTTLSFKTSGSKVNVEFDMLLKRDK
jgi:riboflavin synthase